MVFTAWPVLLQAAVCVMNDVTYGHDEEWNMDQCTRCSCKVTQNETYYYVISDGSNHLQHPTLLASLATSFITKLHHSMYNMFFFTSFIFEP